MKHLLTFFLTLTFGFSSAQIKNENAAAERVKTYLAELDKVGLNAAVLVELNGVKIVSKGYGFSNKEDQIRNSPSTVFDIGSLTKQFTASAILKLEMDGKLSTDDKITKYFNNVPEDKASITIHDLLRHQSGLKSHVGKDYEKISEKEFLEKVFTSELRFKTGSQFSYSNIGYSLLAMIVEKASGQDYETYLYQNLWQPAQMEMTGYKIPDFDKKLIAVGYETDDKLWGKPTDKEWDKNAPYWHLKGNGGIMSTTEDLYKWHQCLMTNKVLSEKAKQKLYHPQLRPNESDEAIYAYGWNVARTGRNTTEVWHNGTNHIFYANFLRYVDENITMITLSNKYHPDFNNLCFEIAHIIFNPEYKPEIPIADNVENRDFTNRIITTIEKEGLEKAKSEYNKKKQTEQLLEYKMRDEGFDHIDNGKPDTAMQLFEMNVFAYPHSAKALQGLGEGYMETGKKDSALKYFNESLSINPDNPFVKDMIKKLEE